MCVCLRKKGWGCIRARVCVFVLKSNYYLRRERIKSVSNSNIIVVHGGVGGGGGGGSPSDSFSFFLSFFFPKAYYM